jgi:hypothetical protein
MKSAMKGVECTAERLLGYCVGRGMRSAGTRHRFTGCLAPGFRTRGIHITEKGIFQLLCYESLMY